MTAAIVFIPPDLPDDWRYNIEGQAYLARRGYRYAGVYRLWQEVEILLARGAFSCVIVVRREHDPGRGWPIEVMGQTGRPALPPPLDPKVRALNGTVRVHAAPFDESPTVANLSARRDRMLANEPTVRLQLVADQLIEDARRRWMKGNQPTV
jgi:hypothetical protein